MSGKPQGRVQQYLDAIAQLRTTGGDSLVSVVVFGSAATGGRSESSDVDLIIVVPDETTAEERRRLRGMVADLEIRYGLRLPASRSKNLLEKFAEHAGGDDHACFLCSRSDFISGNVGRILGLRPIEELFVDRIVLASVIVSAKTVWGEDLLPLTSVPPIRRLDVFKALLGLAGMSLLSVAAFPVLPDATRYAMGALKHSLHSCYFCYHLKTTRLEKEVEFFRSRLGRSGTLSELLNLRRDYRRSFAFALRSVPLLFRLHLRTARENRFPCPVPNPSPVAPPPPAR